MCHRGTPKIAPKNQKNDGHASLLNTCEHRSIYRSKRVATASVRVMASSVSSLAYPDHLAYRPGEVPGVYRLLDSGAEAGHGPAHLLVEIGFQWLNLAGPIQHFRSGTKGLEG